ncbi:hypothetical protein EXT68_23420 [Pectobacterium parmentieri]|uniref:Hypoticical protein n=1 Tax=Pectobacterium parmentieri TaxID=1905730 RepID=A0A0H3I1N9_PECPM|nr:hypothetical protein [Pectobacterium parmentieri]AFI88497.1 Hypoticical protein [Pectobacterium parmentieri]AYH04278.1 hypothetical protein C5E25_02130 [Pectobacterium parmentieri]AYH13099.1 hypothetical protein C5E23_02115 [Pectobacterium parmentieri]AYH21801.1 hypothetical protein C5E21_02110 [Pectobacterium parmentieri]MBI0473533.1 hypothetical protein [Pectobacterium parmentieri]
MKIKEKMIEIKDMLERSGWVILNENEIFTVFDDEIEWDMLNERTLSKETLVFCLFDELGRRTYKMSDILYVKRNKDNARLYLDKKNESWKSDLKNFVYSTK